MPTDIYRGPGAPLAKSGFKTMRIFSVRDADKMEMEFNRWLGANQLIEIHSVTEISDEDTIFTNGNDKDKKAWTLLILYKVLSMDPDPDICLRAKVIDSKDGSGVLADKVQYFIDGENLTDILHQLRLSWGNNYVAFLMIYKKRR